MYQILSNDFNQSNLQVGTLLWKKLGKILVVSCPECVAKEKKAIQERNVDNPDVNLFELFEKIEMSMKFDPTTKHFVCKRCGLYATREQVGDIYERLNRKERTRQDHQYDYLDWWQKSKKEKQQHQ